MQDLINHLNSLNDRRIITINYEGLWGDINHSQRRLGSGHSQSLLNDNINQEELNTYVREKRQEAPLATDHLTTK